QSALDARLTRAIALSARAFGSFLHALLQLIERTGDGLFAHPHLLSRAGLIAIAALQVFAHVLHLERDVFGIEFAQGLAHLVRRAFLGGRKLAGGVFQVALQAVVVFHQLQLLLGELFVLLAVEWSRLSRRGALTALHAVSLVHAIGKLVL